jgi:hypothetical protein
MTTMPSKIDRENQRHLLVDLGTTVKPMPNVWSGGFGPIRDAFAAQQAHRADSQQALREAHSVSARSSCARR